MPCRYLRAQELARRVREVGLSFQSYSVEGADHSVGDVCVLQLSGLYHLKRHAGGTLRNRTRDSYAEGLHTLQAHRNLELTVFEALDVENRVAFVAEVLLVNKTLRSALRKGLENVFEHESGKFCVHHFPFMTLWAAQS